MRIRLRMNDAESDVVIDLGRLPVFDGGVRIRLQAFLVANIGTKRLQFHPKFGDEG